MTASVSFRSQAGGKSDLSGLRGGLDHAEPKVGSPFRDGHDTDEHTITVTAMEMAQECYEALCSDIRSYGWPGLLAGEEVASCDNLFMRKD